MVYCLLLPAFASTVPPVPTLDVLVTLSTPSITAYSLQTLDLITEPGRAAASLPPETTVLLKTATQGVEVLRGETMIASGKQLILRPRGQAKVFIQPEGRVFRSYRGAVVVRAAGNGGGTATTGLMAVNRLTIEDYLCGVLPLEAGATSLSEFLCAQAIASRSAALSRMGRHRAQGYDLCGKEHCENYGGADWERSEATAAVLTTKGAFLTFAGRPVDAVYSTCCGGVTASNEDVWSNAPIGYLRCVADMDPQPPDLNLPLSEDSLLAILSGSFASHCAGAGVTTNGSSAPAAYWQKRYSVEEVNERVRPLGVGRLRELSVSLRGESGRVRELKVVGAGGMMTVSGDLNVRRLLGVPSSLFVLTLQRSDDGNLLSVAIRGAGSGHGVGMCQQGAIKLARAGWKHDAILKKYYTGVELSQWILK